MSGIIEPQHAMLGIEDIYQYMQPSLINVIEQKETLIFE
ncbi:hypothetical protein PAUR_a4203 [Pseudoalteromonas aurantia 208]|uniref:Uncharacterized protein n=1 Tax=Pseudoalteromonas aurantia 208 TaxID=1314867 RepID=A0ABR9EF79_9GAMM|nr:hypothetical protein [Pseudoalteromonas aurantia 208]